MYILYIINYKHNNNRYIYTYIYIYIYIYIYWFEHSGLLISPFDLNGIALMSSQRAKQLLSADLSFKP